MTIKELSQLYYLNREIPDLKLKIAELEAAAVDTSAKVTGMPHCSGVSDKVGKISTDLVYYKSTLANRLEQCRLELVRLNDYIMQCDDSFIRQILTYRFVNGLPWNQVAASIGNTSEYSVKHMAYRYIECH